MDTETVTQRQTVMDITLEVPKGLTLESYDAALGDYGGCLLKPDEMCIRDRSTTADLLWEKRLKKLR